MTPVGTPPPSGLGRLLSENARPARVRDSSRAPWLVTGTVCIGAFMGQLDASIVTLATPAVQRHFGVSVAAASWVALAYLLVLVATVVPIGRLADSVGRKMLYVYGFGLFTLSSVGCALAPNIDLLIAGRVLQGLGAAMLQANSAALIRLAVPRGSVGRGIGIQGVAQAVGLALGPGLGGLLIHVGGWRLVFLVNVPAGILGIACGLVFLPRSRDLRPGGASDRRGLALLLPATIATFLTLTAIETAHRPVLLVAVPLAIAVATGIALWRHTVGLLRRRREALVPLDLLGRPTFGRNVGIGLLCYLVLFGLLFITPFELERGLGWRAAPAGLLLTVLPAAMALVTPLAGHWADRRSSRGPTLTGLILTVAGFGVVLGGPSHLLLIAAALALVGAGCGLVTPANNAAIMLAAPRERTGVAAAVLTMTRALGTALGVALTSLLYAAGGTAVDGYRFALIGLIVLAAAGALVAAGRARVPTPT